MGELEISAKPGELKERIKQVSAIIDTIGKQPIMVKKSHYKETSRDLEKVEGGSRSLLEKSTFEDTFSGSA